MACVRPVKTILAYLFLVACCSVLAAARLLWAVRARVLLRVADRSTQLSERCVARRRRGRGACYISRLERQGWGDAAAPVIELRTAPFRCTSETASGQLLQCF